MDEQVSYIIEHLRPQAGDLIVIKAEPPLDNYQQEAMVRELGERFKGAHFLVTHNGIEIDKLTEDEKAKLRKALGC